MEQTLDWYLRNFSTRYNPKTEKLNKPYPSSPIFIFDFGSVRTQWKVELNPEGALDDWHFYLRLLKMEIKAENFVPTDVKQSIRTITEITIECQLFLMAPQLPPPPKNQKLDGEGQQYISGGTEKFCFGPDLPADGKSVKLAWPYTAGVYIPDSHHLWKWADQSENTLHVRVDLKCTGSVPSMTLSSQGLTTNLVTEFGGILSSGQDSDIVIECGPESFPVHKLILSLRSQVFRTMLNTDMTEAKSGVITIEDMKPLVIKQFLSFLYTAQVEFGGMNQEDVIGLIKAGDKYQVTGLKEICFQNLLTKLSEETCGKLAVAAYLHGADVWQKNLIYTYVGEHWIALGAKKEFKELVKAYPEAFLKD